MSLVGLHAAQFQPGRGVDLPGQVQRLLGRARAAAGHADVEVDQDAGVGCRPAVIAADRSAMLRGSSTAIDEIGVPGERRREPRSSPGR